ncbi:C4-dicarboxylate ABC transporter permease [Halomonas litopenaei]|uniref:TRAP transporter large permease protein n=2 Tax=Halomonas TaxID=2745 RepID=A0AAU7KLK8_9GAMM|nr:MULTISPECIES: TRAP transporter large permease [Halomonas]MBY6108936.1 TRAP transporter large permease [Halomonas sp. DP1Y21-3]PTL93742.1 C4-dicarboxylate ABC transporter permease [Halomonas sp. SYSU XM8]PTL96587.1 C4-dicarboxylate ABC transporter permease [Halomonas litopenaei]RQW72582.1 TRAP transporter large permease [Halomonas sp. YLB-10]|tara:strand:+ start:888 stop:2228 length:1341 start_codon:yes stop_codon:yes gene_type:complete
METTIIYVLFGVFFLLLVLGAPITVSLGVAALATYLSLGENPMAFVQIAFTSVGSFPLMALPAFILAGALMEAAGISRRLVDIAEAFAGPVTGGLAAATVFACMFFGAISGSGPATTAAVGMLMIPAMANRGYDRGYGSAITASSGGLGVVIPPSIPMVIFGISGMGLQPPAEAVAAHGAFQTLSIPKLFIAGILPGMVIAGCLLTVNYIISRRRGYSGLSDSWSWDTIARSLKRGVWSILAPLIILGGIYSGLFTPTESAIVAIAYTLIVGIFLHRELKWKPTLKTLETTTWITGRVLLILFTATVFGRLLVEQRVPAVIAEGMLGLTDNLYLIWAMVIAFLLFVGMFMETLAAIMILTPVLLPIMYMLGMDPVHVGIVVVCALAIGFQTPPLGENLFVASGIGGASIEEISIKALPFAASSVFALFVIAYFPEISLWLPRMLGY